MINTKTLLKVTLAWTSIVYVICYAGVAMFSSIRPGLMMYALHMNVNTVDNVLTFGTFVPEIIIWNVIVVLATQLFATLWNSFNK